VLVDEAARKPIGAIHQNEIEQTIGGRIAQSIKPWTIQARTTESFVDVSSMCWHRQLHRGCRLLEGHELRSDRLLLLLTRRRDPSV
jgi:hypothetical protein